MYQRIRRRVMRRSYLLLLPFFLFLAGSGEWSCDAKCLQKCTEEKDNCEENCDEKYEAGWGFNYDPEAAYWNSLCSGNCDVQSMGCQRRCIGTGYNNETGSNTSVDNNTNSSNGNNTSSHETYGHDDCPNGYSCMGGECACN